jgi:hypothetical protein
MTFKNAATIIGIVLAAHIALLFVDAYDSWPSVDVPMHFAGGAAMGMLAIALHDATKPLHNVWWERTFFVLGFVAFVAVLWEFQEFFLDMVFVESGRWVRSQLSLRDTIGDMFFGLFGGLTAYGLFGMKK